MSQRLSEWIDRIHQFFQFAENYDIGDIKLSEEDKIALFELIKKTIEYDDNNIPPWLIKNEEYVVDLPDTESFLNKLHRISFPKLSMNLPTLVKQLKSEKITEFPTKPYPLIGYKSQGDIYNYFEKLDSPDTDLLTGMCKLADINFRVDRTTSMDNNSLSKILEFEKSRNMVSGLQLQSRSRNLQYLEGRDESKLLDNAEITLRGELITLKSDLDIAKDKEEIAKRAYEEAIRATKYAQRKVDSLENYVDSIDSQIDILSKINRIRLSLNEYNKNSSERRIATLTTLKDVLDNYQHKLLDLHMNKEFPVLFEQLSRAFQTFFKMGLEQNNLSSSFDSETQVQFQCAIGIARETLKLWKKLNLDKTHLNQHLFEFEIYLNTLEETLRSFCRPTQLSTQVAGEYNDSTVVLYLSHTFHDTPDNHVETQARVETSMNFLIKRFSSKKDDPVNRKLVIQKCDDVFSPPLWTLSLVHSPFYLNRLWKFSQEAKKDDLYVPLEFDSEWETDDDLPSVVNEELPKFPKRKNKKNINRLSKSFLIDKNLREKLGIDNANKLDEILNPRPGDIELEAILRKENRGLFRSDTKIKVKTQPSTALSVKPSQQTQEPSRNDIEKKTVTTESIKKVRTLYGPGILIGNEPNQYGITTIKLEWGATAYMNSKSFQIIRRRKRNPRPIDFSIISAEDPEKLYKDRFTSTDLQFHYFIQKVLKVIKVQRGLVDQCKIKDAHMSLWLHGRTSRGMSDNIESNLKSWFIKFDVNKLDEMLTDCLQNPGKYIINSFNDFVGQIQPLKIQQTIQDLEKSIENLYQSISEQELMKEAIQFSLARITNKSGQPRANNPRKIKKGSDNNQTPQKAKTPSTTTPNVNIDSSLVKEKDAVLRRLVSILCSTLSLTQTTLSNDLQRRFGFNSNQSIISAWIRYKCPGTLGIQTDRVILKWVIHHRKLLNLEDQKSLDEVVQLFSPPIENTLPLQTTSINVEGTEMETEQTPVELDSSVLLASNEKNEIDDDDDSSLKSSDDELPNRNTNNNNEDDDEEEEDEEEETLIDENKMEIENQKDSPMKEVQQVESSSSQSLTQAMILSNSSTSNSTEMTEIKPTTIKNIRIIPLTENFINLSKSYIQELSSDKYEVLTQQATDDLMKDFVSEVQRREKSHTQVAQEACQLTFKKLSQPILSRFLRQKSIPYATPEIHIQFCIEIIGWMIFSQSLGHVEEEIIDESGKVIEQQKYFEERSITKEDVIKMYQYLRELSISIINLPEVPEKKPNPLCDYCEKEIVSEILECATCPSSFHANCASEEGHWRSNVWYCTACTEKKIFDMTEIAPTDRSSFCSQGKIFFIYHAIFGEWEPACFYSFSTSNPNLALVRLLDRSDGIDEYQWVDLTSTRILFSEAHNKPELSNKRKSSDLTFSAPPSKKKKSDGETTSKEVGDGMSDTYISVNSLKAALCGAGIACKAVDIVMSCGNTNVFACIRPPGHHAGRYGCTKGCLSTGFCILNNASIALMYARIRWGVRRIAVVDIDVHFGNGTAEILKGDIDSFFASVHMIYGENNDGSTSKVNDESERFGFYPANLGKTEITDNYVSVGVFPSDIEDVIRRRKGRRTKVEEVSNSDNDSDSDSIISLNNDIENQDTILPESTPVSVNLKPEFVGASGYLKALQEIIIPKMEAFGPELLIISAGFDGYFSDPLGGELKLSLDDITTASKMLLASMNKISGGKGKVISLLEGGYDASPQSLGLARCVDVHVSAMQLNNPEI